MGVSLLCAVASDDLECPHLYSLRRALVPYRGTDAVSGSMDQGTQLKRCLRLKILNGVNDETRIKVSGREREWSFRNCTHTFTCFAVEQCRKWCKYNGVK